MGIRFQTLSFATTFLKHVIQLTGGTSATSILAILSEKLNPISVQQTPHGSINFFCPSPLAEWRARTLLTKEPETILWIDGFNRGDVLWDIGANVGVYSLYAACRGIQVLAFEPAPGNYYILSRNVELNSFDDRIQSFCIAFNDETKLDSFYMANTELGGALNTFGEATDWKGESFTPQFKQSMLGFTIDDFIRQFSPTFPNHIKIDVDGIEKKIVNGAFQTFSNESVKSVLVELNIELDECAEVVDIMKNHGLKLLKREHAPMFDAGEFSNVYNHIFVR